MGKIDMSKAETGSGSRYPAPYDVPCRARSWKELGDVAGLTQFGVSLFRLEPGAWSSQRHWHALEDEFAWVLEGEAVLVTDAGEQPLRAGECAGFKAGSRDGHHVKNVSTQPVVLLVVGSRRDGDSGEYPDIDLTFGPEDYGTPGRYKHKDGRSY